ncbi:Acetyltransferase (GNAT) family protein [Cupriavidus sp. YR651]|uniref:GNAT family N-acetyltransferase n=1 Tax=Cupriavidus sp. YR651 TaxID=1855315 RepID=UPI0008828213|nr:GNAT family N-acetyltransferase [Cupriavidus sp. YR651]SDD49801.1 Acetyltransferase (GNAT) family protein [Cupriavidus sp. YR651]
MRGAKVDSKAQASVREESWMVRGGAQVTLRAVQEGDGAGLRTFIDALSRESRYFRFLTGGRIADETIHGFVSHHPGRDVGLVVTAQHPAAVEPTIIASAEYVVGDDGIAEFAVVVADDWQGQGLGRRLIQRLQQLARAANLRGMRGDVLAENRRMLAIMRDCGFSTRRNPEDNLLHEVALTLADVSKPVAANAARLPRDWFSAA